MRLGCGASPASPYEMRHLHGTTISDELVSSALKADGHESASCWHCWQDAARSEIWPTGNGPDDTPVYEITEADLPVLAFAASWLSEDTTSEADQPD